MSLTRYDGFCFRCGKTVKAGKGDFQSKTTLQKEERKKFIGRWLVRCFACKGTGNRVTIIK